MNAVPEFTDDITTFSVAGEAATIDPVTGLITIAADAMTFTVAGEGNLLDPATGLFTVSADALGAGVAALVTATNSAGGATGGFRMVITATAAPEVIVPPKLLGTGLIGAAVTLDPGVWSGAPTPALTFQWQRDGVDIAGALAAVYVPGPADDGAALRCAVTARNTAGSLVAVTEPLDVTNSVVTAPLPVGTIPGVVYAQDSGDQVVSAQAGFIGERSGLCAGGGPRRGHDPGRLGTGDHPHRGADRGRDDHRAGEQFRRLGHAILHRDGVHRDRVRHGGQARRSRLRL